MIIKDIVNEPINNRNAQSTRDSSNHSTEVNSPLNLIASSLQDYILIFLLLGDDWRSHCYTSENQTVR